MPKKARVFSREMKLAAIRRMMAGESVTALARELELRPLSLVITLSETADSKKGAG
jgi:transposase-like protein